MDLTPATKSPTPTTTPTTTTPETDTETPPTKSTDYHLHQFHRPSSSTKLISFTNGGLKQHSHQHQHQHQHQLVIRNPAAVVVVVYKECLKNHAASLGGHALDGCGEFMPSPSATSTDPTSLKCAACGCHRNFHRRDPDNDHLHHQQTGTQIVQLHRHTPISSSPRDHSPSPNSVSPPPISSSYNFPANSAPHMLLALSAGHHVSPDHHQQHTTTATVMTTATVPTKSSVPATPVMMGISSNGGKKRFRTKFSQEQKDKMYSFSEKVGWKMQKRDEGLVEELCNEIGVSRGVLKVWMHNNKHTFGKSTTTRDLHHPLDLDHHDQISGSSPNTHHYHHINLHKHHGSSSTTSHDHEHEHDHDHDHGVTNGTGGSSSS